MTNSGVGQSPHTVARRLSCVGGESGDKNQRSYVLVDARFGDYCSAPRVADEHRGAVLPIEGTPGRGDVVSERRERVLHDGHLVAAAGQLVVHAAPAGTVCKRAVH
jgi:hypothetical protein